MAPSATTDVRYRPIVGDNSSFVTGVGAVDVRGPAIVVANTHFTIATQSCTWIHETNCRPLPAGPPTNNLNGSASCGSAPPSRANTTPLRNNTTRERFAA